MVVAGDFSPQLAEWIGTALGRFVPVLGPRRFSEAGDLASIRRLHGIDADAIVAALLAQRRRQRA
jgi:pyruvate dehydrogenase complex dehydrogenase (E1) component